MTDKTKLERGSWNVRRDFEISVVERWRGMFHSVMQLNFCKYGNILSELAMFSCPFCAKIINDECHLKTEIPPPPQMLQTQFSATTRLLDSDQTASLSDDVLGDGANSPTSWLILNAANREIGIWQRRRTPRLALVFSANPRTRSIRLLRGVGGVSMETPAQTAWYVSYWLCVQVPSDDHRWQGEIKIFTFSERHVLSNGEKY